MSVSMKKFKATSPAGLGIAKSGKRQYPFKFQAGKFPTDHPSYNSYGQNYPEVGGFVVCVIPSGIMSAGTVGVLEVVHNNFGHTWSSIFFMDGRTEDCHQYAVGLATEDWIQEIIDYYVKEEGRPERISEAWRRRFPNFTY